MMKGITKDVHGFIDYTYVPMVFTAPELIGFKEERWASDFCRIVSITVLGYSLLTDAGWGAIKLIPYKTHVVLDLSVSAAAIAAPLALKVSHKKARNTLLLIGITGMAVGILSLIGAEGS